MPNKKKRGNISQLFRFALPYKKSYVLVFLMMGVATLTDLMRPKIIQVLIDEHLSVLSAEGVSSALSKLHLSAAFRLALIYLGCVVLYFLSMYLYGFWTQKTGVKIVTDMRRKLYAHVLRLPMTYFDRHAIGGIVTRVTNDTESVLELYTYVITNTLKNLAKLVGILFVMYSMNRRLTDFMLLLTPLIVVISIVFQKKIRKIFDRQRAIRSVINTKLAEDISGMNVIQTFHKQDAIYREFDETNQAYYKETKRQVLYYAIYRPSIELLRTIGLALFFWYGGVQNMNGLITFGVLFAFIRYFQSFFMPILELAEVLNILQSALASASRIFTLFAQPEEAYSGTRKVPEEGLKGRIEFDHVWFRYRKPEEGEAQEEAGSMAAGTQSGEDWILKDVSFTIEPGTFVAFVGATGAGKSTILSLIARFYEVDRGEIRIDGVNVNDYDPISLRRAIGTVQQDVFLFRGDIQSNIAVGRPEVGIQKIEQAAKLVHADSFISRLPRQYDEPVMERGSTLSAGQRQLLSFARTIAGDPSILILDEATANIDTETEQLIQQAISNMARNRTMLAVAHRISTIAGADQIIVMHHGRVAERGTQDELIAKNGLFRVLYELQYGQEA